MGDLFKLISDGSLHIIEDEATCQFCNNTDSQAYKFESYLNDDDNEFYSYLCKECIFKNNFIPSTAFDWEKTLAKCDDVIKSKILLNKTPDIPCFIQNFDWPICCGQLCEFSGIPKNENEIKTYPTSKLYWEYGFKNYNNSYEYPPISEFLQDVGLFKCNLCYNDIFTFQHM